VCYRGRRRHMTAARSSGGSERGLRFVSRKHSARQAPLAFLLHQLPDDDLTIARVLADGSQVRTVTVRPTGEVVLHGDGPDRMLAQAHAGQWCEFDLPLPPRTTATSTGAFARLPSRSTSTGTWTRETDDLADTVAGARPDWASGSAAIDEQPSGHLTMPPAPTSIWHQRRPPHTTVYKTWPRSPGMSSAVGD
jgi:hypothetical protein